jgi:2'-hydroxyisoflavone reductase
MQFLIIGGTRFVGRHIAQSAVDRGHEVTVFHRGKTGSEILPEAEHLLGDRDSELELLRNRSWDATIDTCAYVPRQVNELADALGDRGGRQAFISTVSVYAEPIPADASEDAPLATLEDPDTEEVTEHTYGGLKVACEVAVRERYREPLIIRPTYVIGPNDYTHRFTYWIERIAAGGRVIVPDVQDYGIQFIDVRDQGRWVVELLAAGTSGTFHTVSPAPPFTFADMVDTIATAVAPEGTQIEWVDPAFLVANDVDDSDLPLWVPTDSTDPGISCNPSRAIANGMKTRPLSESVRETLEHELKDPTPNPGNTGWSREKEAEMLAKWDARSAR